MKLIVSIVLLSMSAFSNAANCEKATECTVSNVEKITSEILAQLNYSNEKLTLCSSINLREAAISVKCITSKGTIYERVSRDNFGEAWRSEDGIIWSDVIGTSSFYNASSACAKIGAKLPSREDFEMGESNGFREVLPNIVHVPFVTTKPLIFWTSTKSKPLENGLSYPYVFSGQHSSINFWAYYDQEEELVRCITR